MYNELHTLIVLGPNVLGNKESNWSGLKRLLLHVWYIISSFMHDYPAQQKPPMFAHKLKFVLLTQLIASYSYTLKTMHAHYLH